MQHMFGILSVLSNVLLRCPHTNSVVRVVAALASAKKNRIYFHSRSQMNKTTEPLRLVQHECVVEMNYSWRQRGRVVRAPDLKSEGRGFKSRSDHLAGVVSRWTPVQLLGHACI